MNTCFIFNCRGNLTRQAQHAAMLREPVKGSRTRTHLQFFLDKLEYTRLSNIYSSQAQRCFLLIGGITSLWLVQCRCQVVVVVGCTNPKHSEWPCKRMHDMIDIASHDSTQKSMFSHNSVISLPF
jgi:hypothetical protein